jgi:ribosome-associated translation inhibitor RaiA
MTVAARKDRAADVIEFGSDERILKLGEYIEGCPQTRWPSRRRPGPHHAVVRTVTVSSPPCSCSAAARSRPATARSANSVGELLMWPAPRSFLSVGYPPSGRRKRPRQVVCVRGTAGTSAKMVLETRHQLATDISSGVVYQTVGFVPTSARDEAERMMADLSDIAPKQVHFAKVKVKNDDHRDPDQRAVVEGILDVSGAVVRAQAAGPTAIEALRKVGQRLERRLHNLAGKRQRATKRPPAIPSGEWRSGDRATDRPEFYDRPPEERTVVRRKTYSPTNEASVSEALFDLDVLDYRFFLFTDVLDDKPSIVYEDGDELAIRKVDGSRPEDTTLRPDVRVDDTPAPTITVDDAVSHLNVSDSPFIFFRDSDEGQASVLYRRYDGHYGLIVPATR